MKQFTAVALALLTSAAAAGMNLNIRDAWVRHVPGDRPMAGYFVLDNQGDSDRRLIGASSDAFAMVQLHETVKKDGMSTMRSVDTVNVPAHGQVAFEPGGYHLMLMGAQKDLQVGDTISITLKFDDGGSQSVEFTVEPTWKE